MEQKKSDNAIMFSSLLCQNNQEDGCHTMNFNLNGVDANYADIRLWSVVYLNLSRYD